LSALHTAWSAIVAAAFDQQYKYIYKPYVCESLWNKLHWIITWHTMDMQTIFILHRGTKSKPDAICILYSRQGHNARFQMQTLSPYRGDEHVEQCCHSGQKYNLNPIDRCTLYGLFEIRSSGGGKPNESITCTIITPYHTVSILHPSLLFPFGLKLTSFSSGFAFGH